MKNSKFFLAVGSLVLACGAFMAAKPIKKFTGLGALLHGIGAGGADVTFTVTTRHFTTVGTNRKTVLLRTSSASSPIKIATLIKTINGFDVIYYKP